MFEAIHGSAPDIAGKDIANPSGLLNGACMMLVHVGQPEVAEKIQNAMLKTIEDGIHTGDIYQEGQSKEKVGTTGFADAIIERLGQKPETFPPIVLDKNAKPVNIPRPEPVQHKKELVGVDVFIDWNGEGRNPEVIGKGLEAAQGDKMYLKMITNGGVKGYPGCLPETFCTDHWRCRFASIEAKPDPYGKHVIASQDVIDLLQNLQDAGWDVIKTENLYFIDDDRAYSLGQGE
jgi:isocitrate dehydrogenase